MSNTNPNGGRTSGRDSTRPSRDLLARMNELLASVLMLLPLRNLGDIQTSVLPAPLRNFLLMIPDIDFGPRWRHAAEEEEASEASVEENGEEIDEDSTRESAGQSVADSVTEAGRPQTTTLTRWGALRPDAGALRRQNAIRRRRRCGVERARELHAELRAARAAIIHAPGYPGPLPLFSHHTHLPLARSAELRMDRFLARARKGRLWADTQGEPMERAPSHRRRQGRTLVHNHNPDHELTADKPNTDNRNINDGLNACESTIRLPLLPHVESTESTLQNSINCDSSHVASPESGKVNHSAGRKRPNEYQHRKRKRARLDVAGTGDVIDLRRLGAAARTRILHGLECSYMRSGLAFALEAAPALTPSSDPSGVDMVFSHVGGALDGFFTAANLHLAVHFLIFLCGVRAGGLGEKCAMLNEVFVATLVERGAGHAKVADALSAPLRMLFSGHVVDFHTHDLRFVTGDGDGARRADLVRLQLRQWLHIRPFRHFGELFLLKYLEHAERSLRDSNSCASHRQHAVVFGRNLKELMYDITRGYEFVERARVPFVAERAARAQRRTMERRRTGISAPSARLPFAQEWDRRLCDRLVDYVTCADSCVLNVQLNYVLFTVRVDAAAAVDTMFHRLLPLVTSDSKRAALGARFAREKVGDDGCVLVCALNRKTGRLEVQNTRAALDLFHTRRHWAPEGTPVFLWEPPLDPWSNDGDNGGNDANDESDSDDNIDSDDIIPDQYMGDSDDDIMPFRRYARASAAEDPDINTTLAGWHKREVRDGFGFV